MTVSLKASIAAANDGSGSSVFRSTRYETELTRPQPVTRLPTLIDQPAGVRAPRDWICLDEITLSPVVDSVSRHLYAARRALLGRDHAAAAGGLHSAAAELKGQASSLSKRAGAAACVEWKLAEFASWRLAAVAVRLDAAANAIERNGLGCEVELNALIDGCAWADLERRWLVADESIWYPVCGEAQRHFEEATEAYARQNCGKAVIDVHKAMGYLRLEAGRGGGYAKRALDGALTELAKVALSIASGVSRGRGAIGRCFSIANLSLALAHRAKAAEWWAHNAGRTTGYELKAAALCLESAARWVQRDAATSAIKVGQFAATVGERIAVGEAATRDQVAGSIASLSAAIEALGARICLDP